MTDENLANPQSMRATEYRLFDQVTEALVSASQAIAAAEAQFRAAETEFVKAMNWNTELWSALQKDVSSDKNQLPPELRHQLASLASWVHRQSARVGNGESGIEALIEVNKTIMDGLKDAEAAKLKS